MTLNDSLRLSHKRLAASEDRACMAKNLVCADGFDRIINPEKSSDSFTLFPLLSTELRLKIWYHTMEDPRVIEILWNPYKGYFSTNTNLLPMAFSICYESRAEAIKMHERFEIRRGGRMCWAVFRSSLFTNHLTFYINFKIDTLYISLGDSLGTRAQRFALLKALSGLGMWEKAHLQHLAVPLHLARAVIETDYKIVGNKLLSSFSALQSFSMVVSDMCLPATNNLSKKGIPRRLPEKIVAIDIARRSTYHKWDRERDEMRCLDIAGGTYLRCPTLPTTIKTLMLEEAMEPKFVEQVDVCFAGVERGEFATTARFREKRLREKDVKKNKGWFRGFVEG